MSLIEALILGVVQGITEFLPISSDGHLALFQHVFASRRGTVVDGGESLFFNVMLHLGTLAAILLYYRVTARDVVQSALDQGTPAPVYTRAMLFKGAFLAGVATLPAVVVGLTLKDWVESATANPWIAAAGFLVTAAALLLTLLMRGGQPHDGTNDLGPRPAHRLRSGPGHLAGRESKRHDDFDCACPWLHPSLGGWFQPAHGSSGHHGRWNSGAQGSRPVAAQFGGGSTNPGSHAGFGGGRIRGGRGPDSRCTRWLAMVFFCIPSDHRDVSFYDLYTLRSASA